MTDAFPLAWPSGRPRTRQPIRSRFDQTNGRAISFVQDQIRMLGGQQPVISTNIELRRDGLPYANQRVTDAGAAVYFVYKGRQMCFACDKWQDVYDTSTPSGRPSKPSAASSAGALAIWSSRPSPALLRCQHRKARGTYSASIRAQAPRRSNALSASWRRGCTPIPAALTLRWRSFWRHGES